MVLSNHDISCQTDGLLSFVFLHILIFAQGHMMRVLYLAVSPDGLTIVSGAGDETLRFWAVFPPCGSKETNKTGTLLPGNVIR